MTTEPALPASYQRGSLQYFARKLNCGICCERLGRGKTGALPTHFATSSEKGNDKRMQKVERVVSREEFLIFLLPRVGFSKRKLGRLGTNLDSFGTKVRPSEPAESMLKKKFIHQSSESRHPDSAMQSNKMERKTAPKFHKIRQTVAFTVEQATTPKTTFPPTDSLLRKCLSVW